MDIIESKLARRKMLVNMAKVEERPSEKCVLYNAVTGEGVLFETWAARDKALDSGKYVRRPNQCGIHNSKDYEKLVEEDMIVAGIPFEPSSSFELIEDDINWATKIRFRDSNLPRLPEKYVCQMNVAQCIETGKKLGLDFSDENTRPTREVMRNMIKEKAIELGRDDIR